MKAETWAEATAIFHQVLGKPPEEREALLDRACGQRLELRNEVVSLLAAHDRSVGFLESPPAMTAMLTGSFEAPPSLPGQTIGPYRILHVLGTGGMGVVYAGEDTRLGRRVVRAAITNGRALYEAEPLPPREAP
jgi:serine/threonine-protein kinase